MRFEHRVRAWQLRRLGLREFGKKCEIGRGVELVGAVERIRLGRNVQIGDGARLVCTDSDSEIVIGDDCLIHPRAFLETGRGGRIALGRSNSVNPYCVLYGHGGLVTGDYVRIAAHTVVIPANHVFESSDEPITKQGLSQLGIRIASDVWIGTGCRILDGVEIGEGAVIAAGAVVNRSVPPFAVVAGVPARVVKMRPAPSA